MGVYNFKMFRKIIGIFHGLKLCIEVIQHIKLVQDWMKCSHNNTVHFFPTFQVSVPEKLFSLKLAEVVRKKIFFKEGERMVGPGK